MLNHPIAIGCYLFIGLFFGGVGLNYPGTRLDKFLSAVLWVFLWGMVVPIIFGFRVGKAALKIERRK